jgi:hypothetical protein
MHYLSLDQIILPFRRNGNINAPCTISINPINANAANPAITIHIFNNTIFHISTIHIYNLHYLASYSTLLNIGLNRLANVIFDNSLFCLLISIFFINLINLNSIFIVIVASFIVFSLILQYHFYSLCTIYGAPIKQRKD